jgi:hypothetical protein
MDVDLAENPSAVGELMKSNRLREIVFSIAETAQWLYQSRVAKRTGALAATAHAHTEIGGVRHDRWIGVLSVSSRSVAYEAAHEFGHTAHRGKQIGPGQFIAGHDDLNAVLEELGSL